MILSKPYNQLQLLLVVYSEVHLHHQEVYLAAHLHHREVYLEHQLQPPLEDSLEQLQQQQPLSVHNLNQHKILTRQPITPINPPLLNKKQPAFKKPLPTSNPNTLLPPQEHPTIPIPNAPSPPYSTMPSQENNAATLPHSAPPKPVYPIKWLPSHSQQPSSPNHPTYLKRCGTRHKPATRIMEN